MTDPIDIEVTLPAGPPSAEAILVSDDGVIAKTAAEVVSNENLGGLT